MKIMISCCIYIFSFILLLSVPAHAVDWRFPVGIAYMNGSSHVSDYVYKDETDGFFSSRETNIIENFILIKLTFQPYVQFDNGLGVGLGFGPFDIPNYGDRYFNFPIGADVRYTFLNSSKLSPYLRLGLRYNIASGDYVTGSSPGLFGAIGYEILRKNRVCMGLEASYDQSEIKFKYINYSYLDYNFNLVERYETKKIKPNGLMISGRHDKGAF